MEKSAIDPLFELSVTYLPVSLCYKRYYGILSFSMLVVEGKRRDSSCVADISCPFAGLLSDKSGDIIE